MALIGITGTRALDDTGRANIVALLSYLDPAEDAIVVGGCVGVDAFAGQVAKTMGLKVHVVLPEDDSQVDTSWVNYASTWELGGVYRKRNERIVELADGVWAFPNHATQQEDPHSGTWMTINIAKRAKKLVYLAPQHPSPTSVEGVPPSSSPSAPTSRPAGGGRRSAPTSARTSMTSTGATSAGSTGRSKLAPPTRGSTTTR